MGKEKIGQILEAVEVLLLYVVQSLKQSKVTHFLLQDTFLQKKDAFFITEDMTFICVGWY